MPGSHLSSGKHTISCPSLLLTLTCRDSALAATPTPALNCLHALCFPIAWHRGPVLGLRPMCASVGHPGAQVAGERETASTAVEEPRRRNQTGRARHRPTDNAFPPRSQPSAHCQRSIHLPLQPELMLHGSLRRASFRLLGNLVDVAAANRQTVVAGGCPLSLNKIVCEVPLLHFELAVLVGKEDRNSGTV